MDKQQSTKMPKPFDEDASASGINNNQQQFVLREDDRLKQEEDYRQGKSFTCFLRCSLTCIVN